MNKLLKCKINLSKIDKERIFTGEKGKYLDIDVWIADAPDQFGFDVSIQQQTGKGEPKIYIGNGKTYKPKEEAKEEPKEEFKANGKWSKSKDELTSKEEINTDLPF